jgi:DNA-binding SARP family transcriptional activator/tetratricopeptide (TPR) repeat protein
MHPPQLEIRVLGPLEVLDGGERQDLPPSRKTRALLAYLVATGRPHTRSALCGLFWQDVNDPRAGLRWALSKLRTVVDDGDHRRIVASRERVELDLERAVVDLRRTRTAVPDDPAGARVAVLEEAVAAFRGEFLEGLDLPSCRQYEVWCLGMRERLRRVHLSIRTALTERLLGGGDPTRALPHALEQLRLDPFSEEAYVGAMDVLGQLGRVDRALELYDRCRQMLSNELETVPSPELEAARRRLGSPARAATRPDSPAKEAGPARSDEPRDPEPAAVLAELPCPEWLPEPGPDDPPLVGRTEEIEVLARFAGATEEDARTVLSIAGEPGIGKTRLLRELVHEIRAGGGWVLCGAVFETETIRPYGPWIDLIRALPNALVGDGLDPDLSPFLARSRAPAQGAAERTRLFEVVARLLEGLVEARTPGLVAFDDIQWLDASSAALLHFVARTLRARPLAFALAGREEEIEPGSPPARMLRSLGEEGLLRPISLRRLDASETENLVQAVDATADTERIFAASEGNPFIALAMAGSLGEGTGRPPATIDEELSDRLERLEDDVRALLPWAAALGRSFDVTTLVHVVDRPTLEIVEAIGRLELRGILRATGADRYDFSHSLLRRAAYRRVSAPARRAIHRSIAIALDQPARAGDRSPGAVAHHAELGGLPELSARAYTEAAEHSLWLFALDEAVELLGRGLARLKGISDEDRIPLEMGVLRLYSFRSIRDRRPVDAEARVRRVIEEAREWGLTEVVAIGHATLTELEYQRGAFEEAARSSVRSAEAGREAGPVASARALAETGSCLLLLDQAPEDARRLTTEAVTLSERHGVEMDVIALARALLHHHDGELDDASRAFEEVIRLGRRARDRWWESPALTRMIMVELDRGDPERALSRAREAEVLAGRLGDETEAAFARGLGAVAAVRTREAAEASNRDEGGLDAVDEALRELRLLDSLWSIGHVQAYAAELELERGNVDAARKRAEEVRRAARTVKRPSLLTLGTCLVTRSTALGGAPARAARHLDSPELTRPHHELSHRARQTLRRARESVSR